MDNVLSKRYEQYTLFLYKGITHILHIIIPISQLENIFDMFL